MRRFRFTLHTVRELRDHRETQARVVLADRMRAHAAAHAAAEASVDRHRRAETALGAGARPAALMQQADRDRDGARLGLERAILELRDRTQAVDHARRDLVEARRAVEMLERLEQVQRAEHRRALLAEEEREVADTIEMRSARAAAAAHRARRSRP
jgi:flagellar biosynthesis chaperone FliJ